MQFQWMFKERHALEHRGITNIYLKVKHSHHQPAKNHWIGNQYDYYFCLQIQRFFLGFFVLFFVLFGIEQYQKQ